MKRHDFDEPTARRGTGCVKWDEAYPSSTFYTSTLTPAQAAEANPGDFIPMWVADMDFAVAPAIQAAILRRAQHPVFGYTHVGSDYYDAIISWFSRRHQWAIKREEILYTTGVVPAMSAAIKALTMPGEKVLILSPDYNCFFSSIRNNGCEVLESPLTPRPTSTGQHRFEIDWEDFECKCADAKTTVFLLCSPHNPTGRVWTAEELLRLNDICLRHGVKVVSDEIHCELEMPGHKYTPLASVDPRFEEITITLTSPTKSFNIAGIHISNMVSANPEIRARVDKVINIWEHCDVNQFGVTALTAAYSVRGAEWLRALNAYLWDNYLALKDLLVRELPDYTVMDLEGTYLVWVDCGACKVPTTTVQEELIKTEKVWVNSGEIYGDKRYMRINIACPRGLLMEGLGRFVKGIKRLSK